MTQQTPDVPDAACESSDVVVAVLAAGNGTRMISNTPKHLHPVAGVPIVERVIRAGVASGAGRTLVMVGQQLADLDRHMTTRSGFEIVVQGEPRGTADTVRQALELAPGARWLVSLLGDSALLTPDVVRSLVRQAVESGSRITLLTCVVDDAASYGRIERTDDGQVRRIVEFRNDDPALRSGPTEVNSGVMVLDADWARIELARLPLDPRTGEYLLTDLIDVAVRQGDGLDPWPVDTHLADASVSLGVNDRVQLAEVDAEARRQIRERHMRQGVTILGPETVFIDEDVRIGPETVILPNTMVTGRSVIGSGCEIGPSSNLRNATLGDRVTVLQSTVRESSVGTGTHVGPYAHLRGDCRIGENVHIGTSVEMKHAVVDDGVKCGHFSYLGDATVGRGANIGAGTVTANFDGAVKQQSDIGADAFVGSDSVLVAPVVVGERARTGAGSVVTRDVPADALVMGVPARQKVAATGETDGPAGEQE